MGRQVGLVEQHLGGAPVRVWLDSVELPAAAFGGYTLRHGRADVDSRPEPAQLSLTCRTDLLTKGPVKGSTVRVELAPAALATLFPRTSLNGRSGFAAATYATGGTYTVAAGLAGDQGRGGRRLTATDNVFLYGPDDAHRVTVAPSTAHTVSVSVRRNGAAGTGVKVDVVTYTSTGQTAATKSLTFGPLTVGTITRLVVPVTTGANAARMAVRVTALGTPSTGTLDVDAVIVEQGTSDGSLFDPSAVDRAKVRFTGRVTDLAAYPASRRQPQPLLSLVAVGIRSRLSVKIGDTPWPADIAVNRATTIYNAARARRPELPYLLTPPSQDQWVLARDVDSQPAVTLLDELATAIDTELVETPDGQLWWVDITQRRNGQYTAGRVTLTGDDLLVPSAFKQTPQGVVNDLTVTYGNPQASVRVVDGPAANADLADASQSTPLRDAWAAAAHAREVVSHRSRPRWRSDALLLELRATTPARFGEVLALYPAAGALARLRGLPPTGPYTDGRVLVEGRTERLSRDRWQVDLDVVEYAVGGPSPRISDLPGYGGSSPGGQGGSRWSWSRQATVSAPVAGEALTFKSLRATNPDLTVLASGGWDPDPLR